MPKRQKETKEGTTGTVFIGSTIPRSLKETKTETTGTTNIPSTIPRSLKTTKVPAKCPRKKSLVVARKSQMKKLAVDKVFCLRCSRGLERTLTPGIGRQKLMVTNCPSCGFMTMSESGKVWVWSDRRLNTEWAVVPEGCLMVMDGVEL